MLLTRPPGPASLSAAELLFWTRLHGTTAAIRGRLREKGGESVSSRMTTTTRLTGHEDLQEGLGPEFKLGRLHLSASRLCARRREAKPTGNGQNISRHSKRRNLFIAPCWLTAASLPLKNELLPERFHQSQYQYYTNYHRSLPASTVPHPPGLPFLFFRALGLGWVLDDPSAGLPREVHGYKAGL